MSSWAISPHPHGVFCSGGRLRGWLPIFSPPPPSSASSPYNHRRNPRYLPNQPRGEGGVEMTDLNGKRKAVDCPLAKRRAQHKPQASRRTKRTKEPALPSKRQSSTARAPLPDGCDRCAPVSYSLRNRIVFVPKNTSKPIVPTTSEPAPPESEFRNEPKYRSSKQTSTCAQMGLEHYNTMNQGDEHELVKAVDSNAFVFNGGWIHANFLAKRKGATTCPDLVPKYFFAELKYDYKGLSCLSCVKLDPGVPRKFGGCGVCPPQIMHPVDGGYRNAQPFNPLATAGNCVMGF